MTTMHDLVERVVKSAWRNGYRHGRGFGDTPGASRAQTQAVERLTEEINRLLGFSRMMSNCCAQGDEDREAGKRCGCTGCEAMRWLEKHDG